MIRSTPWTFLLLALAAPSALTACKKKPQPAATVLPPGTLTIEYPAEGALFPPEFPPPTWLFQDPDGRATHYEVAVAFADGAPPLRVEIPVAGLAIGPSDARCVSATNQPPALSPQQAKARTWIPDDATWTTLKAHSVKQPATITFTGRLRHQPEVVTAHGQATLRTSADTVGAPIFYRDVPLMPSENEKGVIKPLAQSAVPLIAWRLRDVAARESKVMMEGLHTCANCHSFSADGKTLGLDMDGPQNDKGLYALVDIKPNMSIGSKDLIAWSDYRGKLGGKLRVGFMSQVSPDGRHVITTVNDPGAGSDTGPRRKERTDLARNYYVANFKDYRFLQVFYPTRGVLAFYRRDAARLEYLPGADDPRYVHTNAVWAPDGNSLVFARAAAQDAYPAGRPKAEYALDPNETPVRFDLFRIPFAGGKGGKPEPIAGASGNGKSNSFPKVSPDGKWIVFVQSKNGLLMRPDGQLYIVPAKGGIARRMACNTPLMNSWHSFSPNGRWMVFSSKSRSPYTQMFLTHIDEDGNDTPPILIENSTAANRAVNLPEFVNIPPDGMQAIATPAADFAKHVDRAVDATNARDFDKAIDEWTQAIALSPSEARPHNNLGVVLSSVGKTDEAMAEYRKALALDPRFAEAHNNLGEALSNAGDTKGATAHFEKAVQLDPEHAVARTNLGILLASTRRAAEAVPHLEKVVQLTPDDPQARRNLGHALAEKGDFKNARTHLEKAVDLSKRQDPFALYLLSRVYTDLGQSALADETARRALELATQQNNHALIEAITEHRARGQ